MKPVRPSILFTIGWALLVAGNARSSGYEDAIDSVSVRVVKLYGLGAGIQEGYGTGVLVSPDGLVLTVLSLLIDARKLTAVAADGTRYEAEVVRRDPERQLALLQLKPGTGDTQLDAAPVTSSGTSESQGLGTGDGRAARAPPKMRAPRLEIGSLPFFDLRRCVPLIPGDWVVGAGNLFKIADGAEPVSLAHGVFSGRMHLDARRRARDFPFRGEVLVIDAVTSNPGAPGGALVNLDGELVGMLGRVVLSNRTNTHLNYAVPCDTLRSFVLEGVQGAGDEAEEPGWSRPEADDAFDPGIRLVRTGYRKVLPLVEHVRRGSPAERAGVRRDDLILLLNGRNVRDAQAYYKRLRTLSPDEPIDIVLRRGRTVLKLGLREARSRAVVAPSPNGEADELERRVPGDVASDKPSMPSGSESLHLLHATQEEFRLVVERLQPSIVRIDTVGGSYPTGGVAASSDDAADVRPGGPFRDSLGSSFVPAEGATTGIIYSSDGYIITSSLGFVRRPLLITVTLPDGRRLAAEQIARDQVRKIALLKVEASGLSVPQWSEYERLRVGQWAIALGRAFDTAGPSVTVGIVSALNRMSGNAVQTDAKLSPANYGGPLCDISGRVIGICVPMAQRPGELAGIEMYDSGVGFAVPIRRVNEIVETLKTGRSIYRGWLGISVRQHPLDGVVITEVALPSPMHDAGVHPGDILIAAEGKEIQSFDHLMKTLYMIPAGQQVELQLSRAGGEFSVAVTLARASELGSFPDPSRVRQPADE